ncbi:unnamed protein product [Oreochromis niloticus]|nr:unnamed protein product [Mustela putorius furo]
MKDGDVSLILSNVTINDAGTYECRVAQRKTNRRKRANLKTDPISIIYLHVAPPGQPGGDTEDGGKEVGEEKDVGKEVVGLIVGLSVSAVLVLVVAFAISFIHRKHKQQASN